MCMYIDESGFLSNDQNINNDCSLNYQNNQHLFIISMNNSSGLTGVSETNNQNNQNFNFNNITDSGYLNQFHSNFEQRELNLDNTYYNFININTDTKKIKNLFFENSELSVNDKNELEPIQIFNSMENNMSNIQSFN